MASRSRVADILIKANVVDELQLRSARAQHDQWGGRLAKVIADMGLADEDRIADAIAQAMGLKRVQLGSAKDPGALAKLDAAFCEQHAVFPVQLTNNGKSLMLAMADPSDLEAMDMAAGRARSRVNPVVAGETEIMNAIARCYRGAEGMAPRPSRARAAVKAPAESDEAELKITDLNGNTVMKMNPYLGEGQDAGAATDPGGGGGSADVLDQLLTGRSTAAPALTAEERQRLDNLRTNQDRSAKVLRAVMELLMEKGYTTQKELVARLKP
ncbi:MAG TPA: hypothetical protein VND93_24165 [Myxococcales bacterium]|jgi:hypothetical protein|nr:hypothetical protein [Myxococcales bacterium]